MLPNSTKRRTMSTAASKIILPKISPPSEGLTPHTHRSLLESNREKTRGERVVTEAERSMGHSQGVGLMEKKLEGQVREVLDLFKAINRLREQYGVISLKDEGQDDAFYLEEREITYNADQHQLNEQVCMIKRLIQGKIDRVISMAKYFPKAKIMIQQLLAEHSQANLTQNARTGKVAAMKAQRRLIENSLIERQKIGH
jgi:hypothetical protein